MSKKAQLVFAFIIAAACIAVAYLITQAYVRDLMAGKTVREGAAKVIGKVRMNCEEAKRLALDEFEQRWLCAPEESVLLLYLKVEVFKMVESQVNAALLERERQNEVNGIWRCEALHYFREDLPVANIGDLRRFQFQYFPEDGKPLIFLSNCSK